MNLIHKLKIKFKKPKKVELLQIIEENCTGCGVCAKMCKRNVFTVISKKAVVSNINACVGCGKCVEKMCKFEAINLVVSKGDI